MYMPMEALPFLKLVQYLNREKTTKQFICSFLSLFSIRTEEKLQNSLFVPYICLGRWPEK
jgi:hypothetical protein